MKSKRPTPTIRPLWHLYYWDGPISGVCLFNRQMCYFHEAYELKDGHRRYFVYYLSKEECLIQFEKHKCFQENVGKHTDYNALGKRILGCLPRETHHFYYDRYPSAEYRKPTYDKLVGTFTSEIFTKKGRKP